MAYNPDLETILDATFDSWNLPVVKKKMFGGVAYMVQGNLALGILGDELIIRATPEQTEEYMKLPGIHEFTFARGHMKNIFMAGGEALVGDKLTQLAETGRDYALSLPPK